MAMPRKISSSSAPLCFFALKVSLAGSGGRPRAIFFRGIINDSSFLNSGGRSPKPRRKAKTKIFLTQNILSDRIVIYGLHRPEKERSGAFCVTGAVFFLGLIVYGVTARLMLI